MPRGAISKYKPEFCEQIVEHLEEGGTFTSFADLIGVCDDTLYKWAKKIPEFGDAMRQAGALYHGAMYKYRREYCQDLVEHMRMGGSFVSWAGSKGIDKDTAYDWVKYIPEFAHAKKIGTGYSYYWWEKIGTSGMAGKMKSFNPKQYAFSVMNRFPDEFRNQTQKVELVNAPGEPFKIQQEIPLVQVIIPYNNRDKAPENAITEGPPSEEAPPEPTI